MKNLQPIVLILVAVALIGCSGSDGECTDQEECGEDRPDAGDELDAGDEPDAGTDPDASEARVVCDQPSSVVMAEIQSQHAAFVYYDPSTGESPIEDACGLSSTAESGTPRLLTFVDPPGDGELDKPYALASTNSGWEFVETSAGSLHPPDIVRDFGDNTQVTVQAAHEESGQLLDVSFAIDFTTREVTVFEVIQVD